jgi:hypothetical protein
MRGWDRSIFSLVTGFGQTWVPTMSPAEQRPKGAIPTRSQAELLVSPDRVTYGLALVVAGFLMRYGAFRRVVRLGGPAGGRPLDRRYDSLLGSTSRTSQLPGVNSRRWDCVPSPFR